MLNKAPFAILPGLIALCFQSSALAMGLRSFVALPVEKAGIVWRGVLSHDSKTETNQLTANLAYGINHRKTLLLGIPYQLSTSDDEQLGDLSVLYRQIVIQEDELQGTTRLGLLAGAVIPTDSSRHAALQAGTVATWFRGRNEWDVDILYQVGTGSRQDTARYDLSWQHRLVPTKYQEWGIQTEWYGVVELGGRWTQGSSVVQQLTLGWQWIQGRWVIESGVVRDLNGPKSTRILLSLRFH